MRKQVCCLALMFCLPSWVSSSVSAADKPKDIGVQPVLGIEELSRLDLLPKFRQSIKVGNVSSYDRTGGNDDGFSGKYSFIRKEAGGLVLADLEGPGIIYRIHLPKLTDDVIEFYFDGEATPRISLKMPELFDGMHPPFLKPLVASGAGGNYSYVPLTYQRSCKVLVKAEKFNFYQINFAQYPREFVLPTIENPPSEEFLRRAEEAGKLLQSAGSDITSHLVPKGTPLQRARRQINLLPGKSVTLFETNRPGRIVGLTLSPAWAFAGREKDLVLKMYWDGDREPAVNIPVSDLFGYSFGEPASRSLLFGTRGDTNYLYFPMPFEKSARIELASERASGPTLPIEAEIITAPIPKGPDEGRFYAVWHRENPTKEGAPFTYLHTSGRGHVVGTILQAQGFEPGSTEFFEGDDRAVIDGNLAVAGLGSEDSFNGGWYDVPGRWFSRTSYPLSGCLDYKKQLARTGGYRLLLTDSYAYRESIDYTIEHGPEGNRIPTDYTSVVFLYSENRPTGDFNLPPVAARRIFAPPRIVFTPGWNIPIHSISLQNSSIENKTAEIAGKTVRFLSVRATGEDIFGPHHIALLCEIPERGKYQVSIEAVEGPEVGTVQILQNGAPAGPAVNFRSAERKVPPARPVATLDLEAGDAVLYMQLTGDKADVPAFGLDLVKVIFERVEK